MLPVQPIALSALSLALGVPFQGNPEIAIEGVCGVENPRPGHIVMAETAEQLKALASAPVAAILHPEDLKVDGPALIAAEVRVVFAHLLELFHPEPKLSPGIHPTAVIDSRASVHTTAYVGPHCLVGPAAMIGENCFLQAFVSLGQDCILGAGCRLYAHVVVGEGSELGPDCHLEPWSQIGNNARLSAGVDLGAHSCLGREVQVEAGAKFDNLVVVGPRSRIGAGSLLVGQSSVDRDAHLHAGVVLAGQSAVGPEAELVSGVQLGGRGWALGKLDKPGPYWGNPAVPFKDEMRRQALERKAQRNPKGSDW